MDLCNFAFCPTILVYFSGGWDVHWGVTGILPHGHWCNGLLSTRFQPAGCRGQVGAAGVGAGLSSGTRLGPRSLGAGGFGATWGLKMGAFVFRLEPTKIRAALFGVPLNQPEKKYQLENQTQPSSDVVFSA